MDLEEKFRKTKANEQRTAININDRYKKRIINAHGQQTRVQKIVGKYGLLARVDQTGTLDIRIIRPGQRWALNWVGSINPDNPPDVIDREVEAIVLKHGEKPGFWTSPPILLLRDILGRLGAILDS